MKIEAKKILVLRMSGVGDVLWTTPFIANLRKGYPQAKISYVVRDFCAPVLENNPDMDELLIFRKGSLSEQWNFLSRIRKTGYDLTIDLVGTPRTAIQSIVSGARNRVGFDFGYRRFFYNHLLDARKANHGHEVEFNLSVLEYLELLVNDTDLVFNLTRKEIEYRNGIYAKLGLAGKNVIGLIPTGGWACKRWPVNNYIDTARTLAGQGENMILVFWGSPSEEADAKKIIDACPAVKMVPKTDLRQLAALLSGCSLVIGNDSGPLHIATAFKIPVISFYGPTVPKSQGPWGQRNIIMQDKSLDCLGCNRIDCPEPVCMKGIASETVITEAERILSHA